MKTILSILMLCLLTVVATAQPINKSSTEQLRVFGTELYENGDYINALEKLKEYYKEERGNLEVQYMLADASFNIKDFEYAIKRYDYILKKDKEQGTYDKDMFNYGMALKMSGLYDEASDAFEKFIDFTDDERLKELAKIELAGAQEANDMLETLGLTVKRLDNSKINSKQSEYSPSYASDGQTMYYASFDENKLIVLDGTNEEDYHLKIFKAKKSKKGKWEKPTALSAEINREDFHTGNVKISPDGQSMYFTRAEIDPSTNAVTSSKIYVSYGSDGNWSPAQEVQGVNGPYLAKHPAIGELFGREVLYFSANMQGGEGYDIYYATNKGDGVFGDPVKLLKVNTIGDEETPFYKDGNLYFSSNGHPGMGGADIFYSTWNGTTWSMPTNMGKGYNSPLDDLFFSLSPDGYSGFLTSNRVGTSSVESSTCCNDIYEVLLTKVEATLVTGAFTEDKKPIDSTDFQLIEMTNGKLGKTEAKNSNKSNKVNYALELDKAYMVIATKEGYFPDSIEFNTVELDETTDFAKVLFLKKKPEPVKPKVVVPDYETITINQPIELKNILFDFDKSDILPEAEIDLAVILGLMNKYPEMKIQLNSHTDAQGKDKYNQQLSQRRASSTKRWLIQNGVEVSRIRAVGKGEAEIRNECENGVKCDDDQHRFNRRTEFVITEGPTTIQVEKKQFNKGSSSN